MEMASPSMTSSGRSRSLSKLAGDRMVKHSWSILCCGGAVCPASIPRDTCTAVNRDFPGGAVKTLFSVRQQDDTWVSMHRVSCNGTAIAQQGNIAGLACNSLWSVPQQGMKTNAEAVILRRIFYMPHQIT